MNLKNRLQQFFGTKADVGSKGEDNFFQKTTSWLGEDVPFFQEDSTEKYITDGFQKNAAIYSIVSLIVRNSTTIPFKVYEVKNRNLKADYTALTSGQSTPSTLLKASMIKAQAFTEVENNPILDVLSNPNPSESWSSFIQNYIGFGKLTGNRYIYGIRDGKGRVREMYILPSQHTEIISGGDLEPIKGYKVCWSSPEPIDFTRDEILHIKDFNPYFDFQGSQLYGQSPLKAGWRMLEINNEVINTTKSQLQNQSARGMLVTDVEGQIDKAQAKQIDLAVKKKMRDADGGIAIINQPMRWVDFGLSPADMELINQGDVSFKSLCNLYGVPDVMLNNTASATKDNFKQAKSFLFQNAIIPEMIKLRDELNRWFVPNFGENLYLDFDFTVIPELQEDISEMVNQLDKAWYMTPNQKRKVLYMPEDTENEQMNEYFVPVNLMPMKAMDLQTPQYMREVARINQVNNQEEQRNQDEEEEKSFYKSKAEGYNDYPKAATNNAKKVLGWIEKYGRDEVSGMTSVGLARANQLAKRESLSRKTIGRMAAFERHRQNSSVAEEYKGTPWKDKGHVAWLGWGGSAGIEWAQRKLKEIDNEKD